MTVEELREKIKDLPATMEVIIQKDSEGNNYSPLAGTDSNAIYLPDSTYSGEVYNLNYTASDNCMTEEEWEEHKKKPRALILYPVN